MFKHVLVPTDGSALSENAVRRAAELAKFCGAKLTALHAVPKFHVFTYHPDMLEATRDEFIAAAAKQSKQFLEAAQKIARNLGVECDGVTVTSDDPHQEIIDQVKQRGCDLVVMASHGRHGVEGLLIGSETHKVLIHSQVPVLVYR